MTTAVLIILAILYAIQSGFAVNSQKQINELREQLFFLKEINQNILNFIAKKSNNETNTPTNDTK